MSRTEAFAANDKTQVRLKETRESGHKAFLSSLTPDEKRALKQLKKEVPELCEGQSDSFLMKFIWARKLDTRRAAEVLGDHLKWRQEWDLENLDTEALGAYFRSGISMWVPGLYTREGYSATFIQPRNLDLEVWKKHGSKGMMHATYYVTDLASDHDIDIGRQGTVMVLDFAGASWSNILTAVKGDDNFDISKLIDSAQNHMPSRVRDVILLNAPWWMKLLLGIVKPLLKSSLRRKIHSCKYSELGNYFTQDNILQEWGGTRKFDQVAWAESLLQERPTLSEGKYIDPSPRDARTVHRYTGTIPIGSPNGTAAIAKSLYTPGKLEAQ